MRIAIASGKGGAGKTTVTVSLASTLSAIWGRIRELAYAPRKRG